jgi:ubiquinone/menaquinone biosynthesis C-methylase UbiE
MFREFAGRTRPFGGSRRVDSTCFWEVARAGLSIYLSIRMNGSTLAESRSVFDAMSALGDSTRARLLALVEAQELTVGELCAVVQLPQSTVSRHLKVLADHDLVTSRADGTSRRYRATVGQNASTKALWRVVGEQVSHSSAGQQDVRRLRTVLSHRRTRSQEFFSTAAGEWDRLREDLFGARTDLVGLLGLLDEKWKVADLGCGTGRLTEALAPFVREVIAVDESASMLATAKARLRGVSNVRFEQGDLTALSLQHGTVDAAVLVLVLHYVLEPERVLREARQILRPGGKLLVVDMMPHDRVDLQEKMGHVWRGFSEETLQSACTAAGLSKLHYVPLSPDPAAKGPSLFAAHAKRAA